MKPSEFLALSERFRIALEKRCQEEKLFYKFLGAMHPLEPYRLYFIVGDDVWSLYNDGETAQRQFEGKAATTRWDKPAQGFNNG